MTMRSGILIERDYGDAVWAPSRARLQMVTVDGQERVFYRFAGDNKFASFLGFKQSPHPFNKNTFVNFLKRLRNEAVARMMAAHHVAEEEQDGTVQDMKTRIDSISQVYSGGMDLTTVLDQMEGKLKEWKSQIVEEQGT